MDHINPDPLACQGREAYITRGHAEQSARRRRRRKDVALDVFKCPFCQSYHVGSSVLGRKKSLGPRSRQLY